VPYAKPRNRLETVPRHLIITGGGYIGLEFAQMYRRFG
jgi:pyruvate/2-oxoglutarate dehydrogenase complex dihydrolipoamide dehydrogenase (E3) component